MIERKLRESFDRRARLMRPSPDAWDSIEDGIRNRSNRPRTGRVSAIALALVLTAGSGALIWNAFSGQAPRVALGATGPATQPSLRTKAVVSVGGSPNSIAFGEGAVWVSVPGVGDTASTVDRIDPTNETITASIDVKQPLNHLVAGAGAVWGVGVTGNDPDISRAVVRIDPKSNEVSGTISDVGAPLATSPDAVWGVRGTSVVRIDPGSNEVVATIALDRYVRGISTNGQDVWILAFDPDGSQVGDTGHLIRVDAATNQILADIALPYGVTPTPPVVAGDSVWLSVEGAGAALRVDAQTNEVSGAAVPIGQAFLPFAASDDGVWFQGGSAQGGGTTIGRLNAITEKVDASIVVSTAPSPTLPPSAVVDEASGTIWVASYEGSVTKLEV